MFTGIVTAIGTIASAEQRGDLRLRINAPLDPARIDIGASIACSGVCLTVVERGGTAPPQHLRDERVHRKQRPRKRCHLQEPLRASRPANLREVFELEHRALYPTDDRAHPARSRHA